MSVIEVFQSFTTQEQAIEYLEKVRWRDRPTCPYCKSESVGKHPSGDRAMRRWQCWKCTRAFAVTVGTTFHGTHKPLRDWFMVLALMLNAKKSASACQIARDTGIRRPTVWSMMHRIRLAMAKDPEQEKLMHGIVEADETYVGGKPRKGNRHGKPDGSIDNFLDPLPPKNKRGRGTRKTPVIGMVERNGRVIAQPANPGQLSSLGLSKFIGQAPIARHTGPARCMIRCCSIPKPQSILGTQPTRLMTTLTSTHSIRIRTRMVGGGPEPT